MLRLCVRRSFGSDGFNFYLFDQQTDGKYLAKPIDFVFDKSEPLGDCALLPQQPTFHISKHDFDSLKDSIMRELSFEGLETMVQANASELKATKYHLEDMRILAGVVPTIKSNPTPR